FCRPAAKRLKRKARLVAIFFKAVQAGRGRSPALVKQNGLPPMQPGFLARERQKGAHLFLNLLTPNSAKIGQPMT
ncbi:MAG: hypothetical protein LBT33_11450, partial [Spirochaetia bacterium]|nr:hypothetical protein [Spirochaetia bacterium]